MEEVRNEQTTLVCDRGTAGALRRSPSGTYCRFPSFTIPGTPFTYDPANGDLLMDIFVSNSGNQTVFLDARNGTAAGVFSRMHDFGSEFNDWGLVTGFNAAAAVPEPSTYVMLVGGLLALAGWRRRSS